MANVRKYREIVEWTVKQITAGVYHPQDKFFSEAALGKKFGYSRQTVRRALEVLERQGHITRIQGSGTYIASARPPAVQRSGDGELTMTIGLISTYLDDFVFPRIIRGIESVFSASGLAVQLAFTNNLVAGETRALQLMLKRRLDGLIVEPTRSALPCVNLDLYHAFTQRGLPLVFIDSFYPELSIPYIALDDEKAGYVATRHLFEMGHRNIMGIFPHSNRQGHLRYLGYMKALSEQGIPIRDDRVCWYSKENMQHVLHGNPLLECLSTCTAALCYNDQTALTIIEFLRQNGRNVPEDLSVVGIDNSTMAKVIALTSVAHPGEQLGEAAAQLMLSMINGSKGKNILFPPKLVMRSSVRRIAT